MNKLKENKPLRFALGVLLLVLLCFNLPNLLFVTLCLKEDIFRPPHTEVLVSACKKPVARGVPGGEAVFVYERRTGKMYLLDLRTGEKNKVPDDPLLLDKGVFLNSELVWLEGSGGMPSNTSSFRPHFILDLKDGRRYEVFDLTWLPRQANGYFDPKYYSYFQSSNSFFIHHSKNYLIALSPDFRASPDKLVILSQYALESGGGVEHGKILEQLLNKLGAEYEIIDIETTLYKDIPSPTGKYILRNDGVYFSGSDVPFVTREYIGGLFMGGNFKGWYYDESGVVFKQDGYFLISHSLLGSYFSVPRPILKLNLPTP
jgi:hypothetical protein